MLSSISKYHFNRNIQQNIPSYCFKTNAIFSIDTNSILIINSDCFFPLLPMKDLNCIKIRT